MMESPRSGEEPRLPPADVAPQLPPAGAATGPGSTKALPVGPAAYFADTRGVLILWFGMLGPALAWFLHLVISYMTVGYACDYGLILLPHVASVVLLGVTLVAGWVSIRSWNRLGRSTEEDAEGLVGRSRFMAISGMITSAFFALVIVAQWIPAFMVDPCI